jgi:predicted dehydrogenase
VLAPIPRSGARADIAPAAHLPALAELRGRFTLAAVYSRSEASAASLAAAAKETLSLSSPPAIYFDVGTDDAAAPASSALDALLKREDVQGVIVVLPITAQPAVVRAALAAGKAVLSEKPVAADVREGARLVAEYRATYAPKGLLWVRPAPSLYTAGSDGMQRVAENFEAEPSIRAAARAIADGALGDVQGFAVNTAGYVDEHSKYWKTPWRTKPDVRAAPSVRERRMLTARGSTRAASSCVALPRAEMGR